MATELSSFAELKKAAPTGPGTQIAAAHREKEIDAQGRAYATGRRKNAVARVWVKPGTGKITINGRDQKVYFARPTQQMVIQQPFDVTQRREQRGVAHAAARRDDLDRVVGFEPAVDVAHTGREERTPVAHQRPLSPRKAASSQRRRRPGYDAKRS